jgi:hypothetical protein
LAHGTIAGHQFRNFAFNLKGNLAAMATSLVFHSRLLLSAGSEPPGMQSSENWRQTMAAHRLCLKSLVKAGNKRFPARNGPLH